MDAVYSLTLVHGQAQKIFEKTVGSSDELTLKEVEKIAYLMARHLGDVARAVVLYRRLIVTRGKRTTADTVNDYANVLVCGVYIVCMCCVIMHACATFTCSCCALLSTGLEKRKKALMSTSVPLQCA